MDQPLLIQTPQWIIEKTTADTTPFPDFLVKRTGPLFSESTNQLLLRAYKELLATNPKHSETDNEGRSATLAFHFGVWEPFTMAPAVTRDSSESFQTAATIVAHDKFLGLLKKHVVHKLNKWMQIDCPCLWVCGVR
jgi:hypothetical protein